MRRTFNRSERAVMIREMVARKNWWPSATITLGWARRFDTSHERVLKWVYRFRYERNRDGSKRPRVGRRKRPGGPDRPQRAGPRAKSRANPSDAHTTPALTQAAAPIQAPIAGPGAVSKLNPSPMQMPWTLVPSGTPITPETRLREGTQTVPEWEPVLREAPPIVGTGPAQVAASWWTPIRVYSNEEWPSPPPCDSPAYFDRRAMIVYRALFPDGAQWRLLPDLSLVSAIRQELEHARRKVPL